MVASQKDFHRLCKPGALQRLHHNGLFLASNAIVVVVVMMSLSNPFLAQRKARGDASHPSPCPPGLPPLPIPSSPPLHNCLPSPSLSLSLSAQLWLHNPCTLLLLVLVLVLLAGGQAAHCPGLTSPNACSLPSGAKGPGGQLCILLLIAMGLEGAPLTLTLTLLVATLSSAQPCIKTAAPPNVMVAHPDGNATLPCLDGGQPDNATDAAHWTFNGQDLPPSLPGRGLFLPRVQANHSGSYACHVKGRPARTWRLVVEEPPEAPDFSCRQKSLNNEILCEWRAGRTTSLRTKARLWVQKGFFLGEQHSHPCRYYSRSQKFSCRTHGLKEKEDLKLWLSVCLANLAGATASRRKYFTTETLLKPDPPANVTVSGVEGAPRHLRVTWAYPPSWGPTFYRLGFQLRYRAQGALNYSQVCLHHASSYVISDALKGRTHTVQLRCREQFDHGAWSEWSREDVSQPWTEPKDPEPETVTNASKAPHGDPPLSLSSLETPREVGQRSTAPLPPWTLPAVTVIGALGLALAAALLTFR
nr:PREDICTED: interleukin-6 receptor subunit alpha [Anolis carolinensis]|eukprot:XP_008121255.2 PREDICTED: interleukin-6 receptor subunit alpha [Anolis carolinensis]